jgi:hypothetical protein
MHFFSPGYKLGFVRKSIPDWRPLARAGQLAEQGAYIGLVKRATSGLLVAMPEGRRFFLTREAPYSTQEVGSGVGQIQKIGKLQDNRQGFASNRPPRAVTPIVQPAGHYRMKTSH